VNIACLGRNIRSLRVHVPLSLTDTCQLCLVSPNHRERDRVSILGRKHGRIRWRGQPE